MRELVLARTPDEPQFAVALLKLVLEMRRGRSSLEQAVARALHGMRVDRDAFRRHVLANRERFETAACGVAVARVRRVPA